MTLIRKALVLAGFVLAFSFGLTLAVKSGWIETDTMLRAQGVMSGLVLVLIANLVPKTVDRHAEARCDPTRAQAVQRFSGWALVLAGLGQVLAWLVLPIDWANPVSMTLVGTAVVLVLARVAWAFMRRSGSNSPVGPGSGASE